MPETEQNRHIRVTMDKSPDYRRISANGIWGALSSNGELVFDFTFDVIEVPKYIEVNKDTIETRVFAEGVNKGDLRKIRQVGISMPITAVPNIIQWLQNQVHAWEKAKSQLDSIQEPQKD